MKIFGVSGILVCQDKIEFRSETWKKVHFHPIFIGILGVCRFGIPAKFIRFCKNLTINNKKVTGH